MIRITLLLSATLAAVFSTSADTGFTPVFNGKDLSGWEGDPDYWRVLDGVIDGGAADGGPVPKSTFLIWENEVANFHLKLKFWNDKGNSGIQYRSQKRGKYHAGGYQAEISPSIATGFLFPQNKSQPRIEVGEFALTLPGDTERDRGHKVLLGEVANRKWLNKLPYYVGGEWADYDIVCRGNHILHFVNGYPMIELIDEDRKTEDMKHRVDAGVLALQLHSGDEMHVRFKDIRIKQFDNGFGDAQRLFNGRDLKGWLEPKGESWSVHYYGEENKQEKSSHLTSIRCTATTAPEPLIFKGELPESAIVRFQRREESAENSLEPFKPADDWNLYEVTISDGKIVKTERNGSVAESGSDVELHGGRLALPGRPHTEYRNLVCIPVLEPR